MPGILHEDLNMFYCFWCHNFAIKVLLCNNAENKFLLFHGNNDYAKTPPC